MDRSDRCLPSRPQSCHNNNDPAHNRLARSERNRSSYLGESSHRGAVKCGRRIRASRPTDRPRQRRSNLVRVRTPRRSVKEQACPALRWVRDCQGEAGDLKAGQQTNPVELVAATPPQERFTPPYRLPSRRQFETQRRVVARRMQLGSEALAAGWVRTVRARTS